MRTVSAAFLLAALAIPASAQYVSITLRHAEGGPRVEDWTPALSEAEREKGLRRRFGAYRRDGPDNTTHLRRVDTYYRALTGSSIRPAPAPRPAPAAR